MKVVFNQLKTIVSGHLFAALLVALTVWVMPVFNLAAQATPLLAQIEHTYENISPGTIKEIQKQAEDLGDAPGRRIGDTGLKNIRKLGENVPETIDLNKRQQGAKYDRKVKNKAAAMDKGQKKTEKEFGDSARKAGNGI